MYFQISEDVVMYFYKRSSEKNSKLTSVVVVTPAELEAAIMVI